MKSFINQHHRVLFYSSLLILDLLQAGLTELMDDEAYYWVYSMYPAWGYFDHPPLTAILIKMGYALFQNELGVRLVPLLLNIASIFILEKLTVKKDPFLFYAIILSLALLQIAGFMAVPDIPLIFFTALFFLAYKHFLERPSFGYTILLGLVMSALMYSKYHGVLIIFFTVLSRPRLIWQPAFIAAGLLALIAYLPHLYWQYEHDFISFRYHLFESNVNPYKFSYTTEYLAGQLLMAGPLAGFILLPAAFLYRSANRDAYIRALQFMLVGMYLFFLVSSFRGRVEANWTAPVIVPLVLLSHAYLANRQGWKKALFKTLPYSLVLILAVRLFMIADIAPVEPIKERFHSWSQWPAEMKERTRGLPVIWNNSYQRASKYWFYTGQPTHSLNWVRERKNNYNYWPLEKQLLRQPVYHMDIYNLEKYSDSLPTPIGTIGYRYDPAFISFSHIQMKLAGSAFTINKGDMITIVATPQMDAASRKVLHQMDPGLFAAQLSIFQQNKWVRDIALQLSPQQLAATKHVKIITPIELEPGEYFMRLSLQAGDYPATHNSDKIQLKVK